MGKSLTGCLTPVFKTSNFLLSVRFLFSHVCAFEENESNDCLNLINTVSTNQCIFIKSLRYSIQFSKEVGCHWQTISNGSNYIATGILFLNHLSLTPDGLAQTHDSWKLFNVYIGFNEIIMESVESCSFLIKLFILVNRSRWNLFSIL